MSDDQLRQLKAAAQVLLAINDATIKQALDNRTWKEVNCNGKKVQE